MAVTPALVAFTHLLELSTSELEEEVECVLAENPALERLESACCPYCGLPEPCICPPPRRDQLQHASKDVDVLATVAEEMSAAERLLRDAAPTLEVGEIPIAVYILGSLGARGFLPGGAAEIVRTLAVEPARVERVLGALRELGPPGFDVIGRLCKRRT
jgi:RNA polymerase sigma-54 factor